MIAGDCRANNCPTFGGGDSLVEYSNDGIGGMERV